MTAPAPSPLPGRRDARGMRALATAMLAGMLAVFIAATGLVDQHPAWGFVRAFAEAGLVGGIADWFAVTALFRHPLGLPIPHTAIIPRNKDRIGDDAGQLPARQLPDPDRRRAADAQPRRRRRGRPLPRPAAGAKGGCAKAARGCSPTSSRRSTRRSWAAW